MSLPLLLRAVTRESARKHPTFMERETKAAVNYGGT